jgi:hypothetical protein
MVGIRVEITNLKPTSKTTFLYLRMIICIFYPSSESVGDVLFKPQTICFSKKASMLEYVLKINALYNLADQ